MVSLTVNRGLEAGEGGLSEEVVTLVAGDALGDERVSTVWLLVTAALIAADTIPWL